MSHFFDQNTRSYQNERVKQDYYDPNTGANIKRDYQMKNKDGRVDLKVDERIKQHDISHMRNDNLYHQGYDRNLGRGIYGSSNLQDSNMQDRDRHIGYNRDNYSNYNRGYDINRNDYNYNTDYNRGYERSNIRDNTDYDRSYGRSNVYGNTNDYDNYDNKRGFTDKVKDFFGMGNKDYDRNYEEHRVEHKYSDNDRYDHDVKSYNTGPGLGRDMYHQRSKY